MKRKSLKQLQREADKADERMADSAIVITIGILLLSIFYNWMN